ncbi:hypothetical protein EZV62_007077 [Acer yangbiense]|uniref:Uncharacterized protein n=1 Tax=Acer yangbiense TaxID=1000413 RepID=A0A5C7IAT7_9ROSI|nr:hypothetical protein EZV62_007077 [Acer yangbiense]
MSGFGYMNRGSSTINSGLGPRTNDWSSNTTTYDSDHVCRPVIIDAEGRKHPIVSYAPTEAYITETETIVQRVHAPVVTQYQYSSPAEGTMYARPISPIRDRPQYQTHSPFSEYNKHSSPTNGTHSPYGEYNKHSSPTNGTHSPYGEYNKHSSPTNGTHSPFAEYNKLSSPTNGNHSPFTEYNKHSSPTKVVVPLKDHGYGEDKWHSKPLSPVHERPQKVEEFITKVQIDASRPNRFPLSSNVWRQSPNSDKGYHGNTTGYGRDYSDLSSKESYKPSVHTIRNEDYDDYNYRRNDTPKEPTMNTSGGWIRPNQSAWASPPNSSLSKPTNDIGTAMEILKESARPTPVTTTAPYSRFTVPLSTGPKRDGYSNTIDSKEAQRRYANSNLSSSPVDNYTATIDSREAVKKYNGAMM